MVGQSRSGYVSVKGKGVRAYRTSFREIYTLIDRVLHGCGRRGDMLWPIKATRNKALEAGHYRFLRDGLWVIGQENDWLIEQLEERHVKTVRVTRRYITNLTTKYQRP